MTKRALILLPLLLAGCDAIGNWADNAGKHMPVINEEDRCEHWQCMTEEGQAISDKNKLDEAKALQAHAVASKPTTAAADEFPAETAAKPAAHTVTKKTAKKAVKKKSTTATPTASSTAQ